LQRNFGLDLLRCIAIVGVVISHLTDSMTAHNFAAVIPVDLFFSLSGFLIAQMMVERFDGISSPAAFWAFMTNRWLRTIPLYLLALCAYLCFLLTLASQPVNIPSILTRYVLFIQYIPWSHDSEARIPFFLISWSLAIEEWFYLLCPLLLLLAGSRSRRFFVGVAASLVMASITYRLAVSVALPSIPDSIIHTSTLTRGDAFVYGIAAYFVVTRGIGHRRAMMLAGLTLATVNFLALMSASESLYCRVLIPSLAPLSMALVIPAALTLKAHPILARTAAWLSTRTYAVYLFNVLVVAFTFPPGHHTVFRSLAFVVATGLLADFLYRYVERPFMRLRPMRTLAAIPTLDPVRAERS